MTLNYIIKANYIVQGGELIMNVAATINVINSNPKKAGKSSAMDKVSGNFQELLSLMQENSEGDFNDTASIEIQSILLQLMALNQSENPVINIFNQKENQPFPLEINSRTREQIQQLWLSLLSSNGQKNIDPSINEFYNGLKEFAAYFFQSDTKGNNDLDLTQLLDDYAGSAATMGKDEIVNENNKAYYKQERFIEQNIYLKIPSQMSNIGETIDEVISEDEPIEESVDSSVDIIPKEVKSRENPARKDTIKVNKGFTLNENPVGYKSTPDSENLSIINSIHDTMHFQSDDKTPVVSSNVASYFEKEESSIQPQELFNQIIDKLETAVNDSEKQISVRLKPEFLGDMVIKIYAKQDEIRAQMFIEKDFTRDIIQLNVAELKRQFEQQGMNITEIDFYDLTDSALTRDFGSSSYHGNSDNFRQEPLFYKYEVKEIKSYSKSRESNWLDLECNVNYVV